MRPWRLSLCLCLALYALGCPEELRELIGHLPGIQPPPAVKAQLYSLMKSAFTAEMSGFAEQERFFPAGTLGEWGVRVPEGYQLEVRLGTMAQLHPAGSFGAEAASRGGPYGGGAAGPGFFLTVRHLDTGFCAQITESGAQRLTRGEDCGEAAPARGKVQDAGRRKPDVGGQRPDDGRRTTSDGRRRSPAR